MLAAIKNLRAIRERCHDGAPLDPSLSHWLAESLDRYLGHECASIDDALGLRQPRGGMPWWLVEAMYERDGALRDLADAVQVIDGLWIRDGGGIRTAPGHVGYDRTVAIGLAKLFAVLILHECAIARPEGAMRAASTFDLIYPALRPFIEDGRTLKRARRAGAKEGVKARKKKANALHAEIVRRAEEHRANGRDDHELSRLISKQVDRTPHTVRRVLQNHGILSKRKRT